MGWGVYRLFTTADGDEVFIGITSNAHWQRFCDAFSLAALKDDPAYADNRARVSRRNELGVVLGELIGRLRSDEVQRRLLDAQVPHAPLRRPDQLHREPALRDSGQLVDTPLPSGRSLALPKMPIRAEGFDMALRRPAPALGEDSREVLARLGYSPADIEELIASGAVGGPPGA
jgi:crotonobetainyl-CoA:carnitine CoA-transferase CaiB-like acyl-CoA transferase